MKLSVRRISALASATIIIIGAGTVLGYATPIHAGFWELAFGDKPRQTLTKPATGDLDALRSKFYDRASAHDPAFKAKYPTAASFDVRAWKELLALNPDRQVSGIDLVPLITPTQTDIELGRAGSVMPDDDTRNQDRMFVKDGKVVLDPFGRAVPYDPRTTWFGGLTGTPSQFDAHGATLRDVEHSDSIFTAFRHPERWSRPPVPLGSAPEFSQLYTDLALQAKLQGGAAADWQAVQFEGNAFHGIEDLGNQIHTTVIGIPEFFIDAKLTYYETKVKGFFHKKKAAPVSAGAPSTLTPDQVREAVAKIEGGKQDEVDPKVLYALGKEIGGQLSDVDLGIRIIGNHHRLLEDFFMKEYLEGTAKLATGGCRPEVKAVHDRALAGDKDFEKACRANLDKAGWGKKKAGEVEFGRIIAETMIDASAYEAAPIYRAIRSIAKKELRRGMIYPADVPGTDPRDWITTKKDEHTDLIFELHARAFARVITAMRLWQECFDAEVAAAKNDPDAASRSIDRVTQTQLKYLADATARRDKYLADKQAEWDKAHPPTSGLTGVVPGK